MMLLEKQGRSSQRQRMQEQPSHSTASGAEPRRAGSLPPSSLPRPPRSLKSQNSRYCRLSDSETRKKSDPGLEPQLKVAAAATRDSGNCTLEYGRFDGAKVLRRKKSSESIVGGHKKMLEYERLGEKAGTGLEVKRRETQARSLIPPPSRRIGLEYGRLSDGDAKQPRKSHESSASSSRGQSTGSIMSTKSEASTASLQPPPPTMLKAANRSIPRPSNYRIQF
jgi:angiomotin like 1